MCLWSTDTSVCWLYNYLLEPKRCLPVPLALNAKNLKGLWTLAAIVFCDFQINCSYDHCVSFFWHSAIESCYNLLYENSDSENVIHRGSDTRSLNLLTDWLTHWPCIFIWCFWIVSTESGWICWVWDYSCWLSSTAAAKGTSGVVYLGENILPRVFFASIFCTFLHSSSSLLSFNFCIYLERRGSFLSPRVQLQQIGVHGSFFFSGHPIWK